MIQGRKARRNYKREQQRQAMGAAANGVAIGKMEIVSSVQMYTKLTHAVVLHPTSGKSRELKLRMIQGRKNRKARRNHKTGRVTPSESNQQ